MYENFKRYAKSVILFLLICSSLFLVSQIWFGSYFMPGEYYDTYSIVKSFMTAPLDKLFGNNAGNTFSQNIKSLIKPEKVVANMAGKRSVQYRGMEGYDELLHVTDSLMTGFLLGEMKIKSKDSVEQNEYFSVLRGKSFYVDYGNQFDSKLFSVSICGESKTAFTGEVSVVREYMILFNESILDTVSIYFQDYKTKTITKYTVEYNKAKLETAMTKHFNGQKTESTASYSFELNFHQEVNSDNTIPKVIFSPLILLHLVPEEQPQLYPEERTYFSQNGEMDTYTQNEILKEFSINPMTMRKYVDLSNSKVFVENDGTLTIDPEGFLEYKTLEGARGLNLDKDSGKTSYDAYTNITLAVDFVSSICNSFPKNMLGGLRISSDVVENPNRQGVQRITFDYYVGGVPVMQIDPQTGEPVSAVILELENGYLKYYRQCLTTYGYAETTQTLRPVIHAVDDVVDRLKAKDSSLYITKIGTCYVDDGTGLLSQKWKVRVNGSNNIAILD